VAGQTVHKRLSSIPRNQPILTTSRERVNAQRRLTLAKKCHTAGVSRGSKAEAAGNSLTSAAMPWPAVSCQKGLAQDTAAAGSGHGDGVAQPAPGAATKTRGAGSGYPSVAVPAAGKAVGTPEPTPQPRPRSGRPPTSVSSPAGSWARARAGRLLPAATMSASPARNNLAHSIRVFAAFTLAARISCSMIVAYHVEMRRWETVQKMIKFFLSACI
jgi:hypothetical protein